VKRYDKVKQILDTLVSGQSIGGHGAFWRGLTYAEFLTYQVFGQRIVLVGDSTNSSLIKALRAQYPFGSDTGTQGSYFRRMPAGRPPATQSQIDFIARWIDDGCPDDIEELHHLSSRTGHPDPSHHNEYWREFDNWAMFNAPPDVVAAINLFFPVVPIWFSYAKSPAAEQEWSDAIQSKLVQEAIELLSAKQAQTVERFYGSPPDLNALLDSYTLFGSGNLPPDALRPQDPDHKMNGREMWFVWCAFADGALRSNVQTEFWYVECRAILVGLLHDGLFRGRFNVQGFSPDSAGSAGILALARGVREGELSRELRTRYAQSGL
jgi:hypothetical protein